MTTHTKANLLATNLLATNLLATTPQTIQEEQWTVNKI
jgi:hypothetical protein